MKKLVTNDTTLPFRMTNDYLFKFLLQTDKKVLTSIVCSYLDFDSKDIRSIDVTNPIELSDDINAKEMILDIRAEMNNDTIINLEMQIINYHDWPERSISYLCRCFDNLKKGEGYINVKGAIHLGFLNYTLFQDFPEFFATYRLFNEKTHQLYSSKFRISVVDLTQRELATEEDKAHLRVSWASFFKATTWEELEMISKDDPILKQAYDSVKKLSEDELFREQCRAREDRLRQEIDRENYFNAKLQEKDSQLSEKDSRIQDLENELAQLKEQFAKSQQK